MKDVCTARGGGLKSGQLADKQYYKNADKGEGVKKPDYFTDVHEWSLFVNITTG